VEPVKKWGSSLPRVPAHSAGVENKQDANWLQAHRSATVGVFTGSAATYFYDELYRPFIL
jgi:hypothetical protein